MRVLLEAVEPLRDRLGPLCLAGTGWDHRPERAAKKAVSGVEVDPALLERAGVAVRPAVRFDETIPLMGQGRFCPVILRPLFHHLGLVSNRAFETFCADTIPLLLLPEEMVEGVYGPEALPLTAGSDVTARLDDMMRRPEFYWSAVLKTREYLAKRHSYQQRFQELLAILATV